MTLGLTYKGWLGWLLLVALGIGTEQPTSLAVVVGMGIGAYAIMRVGTQLWSDGDE